MLKLLPALLAVAFAATAHAGTQACAPAKAGHARCQARLLGTSINPQAPSGYTPANLLSAYKITTSGSSNTVVAAVTAYGYTNAEADLGVYRAQFGLSACTTANGCFEKLNQNGVQGSYPAQNIGWAEEAALDIDMASAMCPNCRIWLFEANTASIANLAATVNTAASLGAHAIVNSYGGTGTFSSMIQNAYHHLGIALTAPVGDDGFGNAEFPGSSPYVTAVGGTHLVPALNPRGWAETGWTTGACTNFPKQSWQTDPGCANRTIADVAAVADPGVAAYAPQSSGVSAWLVFGGTSVPTAIIGGVYGNNGGTVTYGSNPYAHPTALFDITSGPGGTCTPSYLCNAQVGYDGPTGMGTPKGVKAFGP